MTAPPNPAAWFDLLAGQPGARVGPSWVVTDVPFGLCNSVFFPDASTDVEAVLAAGGGLPQLWWCGDDADPVIGRLERLGVVVDLEELPDMTLALAELPPAADPAPLRIEPADLADFAIPFGASYGITGAALDAILAGFAAYRGDDVRHYVGYVRDEPVACATTIVRHGVCGLYDVGTLDAFRGRGFGAALTLHALHEGAAAGAATAQLQASPLGFGIYERLGFAVTGTMRAVETRPRAV